MKFKINQIGKVGWNEIKIHETIKCCRNLHLIAFFVRFRNLIVEFNYGNVIIHEITFRDMGQFYCNNEKYFYLIT